MPLDAFTLGYIEAALWSSTDDVGDPLDKRYSIHELAMSALVAMAKSCESFQDTHGAAIDSADVSERGRDGVHYSKRERAGHDFWLTRNGHGAGFWDGDWPEELGKKLTEASKSFGECNLYIGDNGLVYVYGKE